LKIDIESLEEKMELVLTVAQTLSENGATTDRIIRNSKRAALSLKIPEEIYSTVQTVFATGFACGGRFYTDDVRRFYLQLFIFLHKYSGTLTLKNFFRVANRNGRIAYNFFNGSRSGIAEFNCGKNF